MAFLGSSLPRQCGIATYTADLVEALGALYKQAEFFGVAMTDPHNAYVYPPAVRFEIAESDIAAYHRAADFLNINDVDLVSIQHEFGLFGGPAGSHVLALLRDLRMPAVTTLHTVLREPDANQRLVMKELTELSSRLVVMSRRGVELLEEVYGVPPEKVDLIHHGIPDAPFVDPSFYKDKFAVEGRTVLLTFGLLSPNKGIEYAIEALPEVTDAFPETVYLVVGATHGTCAGAKARPAACRSPGWLPREGVEDHLIFHDRFVAKEEIVVPLALTSTTPYQRSADHPGTLAYAVGVARRGVDAVLACPGAAGRGPRRAGAVR